MRIRRERYNPWKRRKHITPRAASFLIVMAIALLALYRFDVNKDQPDSSQLPADPTIGQAQEEETISSEIQALLTKPELTEKEYYQLMGYVHRTSEGVRFYRRATERGYLEFTIRNVSVLGEESNWPQENYLHEAYMELDEENNWVERNRPVFLNPDGSPKEGWSLVLVDVKVTSHDAAARIGDYSQSDPYLFRGDGVCTLADLRLRDDNGYFVRSMDYFSGLGQYPEHYVLYRLMPGESIDFTIGFLHKSGQEDLFQYLRLCNTSGNLHSAFIRLDEEGFGKCG